MIAYFRVIVFNMLNFSNKKPLLSIVLSAFWVSFVWGFWTRGTYALGINFAVYLIALILFFVSILKNEGRYQARDLGWIIPLLMLATSFALYENPFFKVFCLIIIPLAFAVFYNFAWIDDKWRARWDFGFLNRITERAFSAFAYIIQSVRLLGGFINIGRGERGNMAKRIGIGMIILFLALIIIIPLLSSADAEFATKLGSAYDLIKNILSTTAFAKLIVFALLSIATLAVTLGWGRSHDALEATEKKNFDPLISGIVLVGILAFYLLFLWIQLDRLWVGALPFDFKATESLVKSGFWQLLFLSFINLAIFFFLYRRTAPAVQKILTVFTGASFLLLVSSAHRMILYVTYYGFSYEKFYALYAMIFCAVLFVWLFSRLFIAERANVLRFVAFQFLWMFALVALFPVESFVLDKNIALSHRPDSRIELLELRMLSPSVLAQVKEYSRTGVLTGWEGWISDQELRLAEKRWYEYTVGI